MGEIEVTVKLGWLPALESSGVDLFFGGIRSNYWVYLGADGRWHAMDTGAEEWGIGTYATEAEARAAVEAAVREALGGTPHE